MERNEILVHIGAPCTRLDDERYAAQAAAIAGFEPAKRICVYPADALVREGVGLRTKPASSRGQSEWRTPQRFEAPSGRRSMPKTSNLPPPSSAEHLISSEEHSSHSSRQESGSRPSPTSHRSFRWLGNFPPLQAPETRAVNPPYRNPLRDRQHRRNEIQAFCTPEPPQRPRTASPVARPHAHVHSLSAKKRSHSDSSLSGTPASIVPDSQGSSNAVGSSPGGVFRRKKRRLEATGHSQHEERWEVLEGLLHSDPAGLRAASLIPSGGSLEKSLRHDILESSESNFPSSESVPTHEGPGPQTPGPVHQSSCFFLANRDYDYDTSVDSSTSQLSQSTDSTESPSQRGMGPTPSHLDTPAKEPEHVDLTTPAHTSSSSPSHRTAFSESSNKAEPAPGHTSPSSVQDRHSQIHQTRQERRTTTFVSEVFEPILSLPRTVFPPPPPTSVSQFPTTHLTPALSRIAKETPFPVRFQPLSMSRLVATHERGYWLLPITVASDLSSAEQRRQGIAAIRDARRRLRNSRLTDKQWQERWNVKLGPELTDRVNKSNTTDSVASEERFHHLLSLASQQEDEYLWTISEFLDFYSSLQKQFTSGTMGWSSRVFLEFPATPPSPAPFAMPTATTTDPAISTHQSRQSSEAYNSGHVSTGTSSYHFLPVILKITSFAELIPHIYLALYLISSKRSAESPMQWRAADEAVVVTMAGSEHGGGIPKYDKDKEWVQGQSWGRLVRHDDAGDGDGQMPRSGVTTTATAERERKRGKESWTMIPTLVPAFWDRSFRPFHESSSPSSSSLNKRPRHMTDEY